jgi:transposase
MKWNYFIGIDVSKETLDCAILQEYDVVLRSIIKNTEKEIHKWLRSLFKLKNFSYDNSLFCMEHTGIYHNTLVHSLVKQKAFICLESGLRIKKSIGIQRGKNDRDDAEKIALYIFKNKEFINLWIPRREVIVRLDLLSSLRRRLIKQINALSVVLKSQGKFVDKIFIKEQEKCCSHSIIALKTDLDKTEKLIMDIISLDPHLKNLFSIITSVPGVGPVLCLEIILTTNEFKNITDVRKYACYAGVAPFEIKSGTSVKRVARVSKIANKQTKSLLHMAAISSISYKGPMRDYFERKVAEGKKKMTVINAIRNKIILRVFACVKQNRKFVQNYSPLDARLNSLKAQLRALNEIISAGPHASRVTNILLPSDRTDKERKPKIKNITN